MCRTQCTNFFNLPCFLLFRCVSKIKRFFFLLVLPIIIIVVLFGGLFTGVFSLGCLLRILGCITGIYLIIFFELLFHTFQKMKLKKKQWRKPEPNSKPKKQY